MLVTNSQEFSKATSQKVMIWWGIVYNHVTPIHFCEKGVKTSGLVYQNMLDEAVELLNETLFDEEH